VHHTVNLIARVMCQYNVFRGPGGRLPECLGCVGMGANEIVATPLVCNHFRRGTSARLHVYIISTIIGLLPVIPSLYKATGYLSVSIFCFLACGFQRVARQAISGSC
jgi:hypothetical protein